MEIPFLKEAMLTLLFFSFFVAWKVQKNGDEKIGCVGFGYVSLVVFIVGMFAIFITATLTLKSVESVTTYMDGEKGIASVISYTSYDSEDDDGNTIQMHTPTYRVTTENGKVYEVKSNFSSGGVPIIGDQLSIYFDEQNQNILELSAITIIMICGMFIMWVVLAFAFVGIIMFAFDCNMSKFFNILQSVGTFFFLPFVMICFEALLIYAFFYGNEIPFWAKALLLFFIIVLGLGIWAIISLIFKKGTPKWKRTGAGSWSADWEDDKDGKKSKKGKKASKKKKKMVPLNEKYLKDTDSYDK